MSEHTAENDAPDRSPLWWHLIDDHGLSAYQIHGDPVLMHAALVIHGLCEHPDWTRVTSPGEGDSR